MAAGPRSVDEDRNGVPDQTTEVTMKGVARKRSARREAAKGAVATVGVATAYATPAVRALKVARAQTVSPAGPPPPPPPPPVGQGCTPGFFKNNPEVGFAGTGFTPGQLVGSVFTLPSSLSALGSATLLAALDFGGGAGLMGAAQILLRASVAALLNAAHPGVNFPRTTAQVIADVNAALATGDRQMILNLSTQLDALNNLGCPLSARVA